MHHHPQKISKYRFGLRIAIVILYIYFIAISIIKPLGPIAYTWNPYVWLPITTFVLFFEGSEYFKIYKNLWKGKYGMSTLIGISAHILYIYSVINSLWNFGAKPYSYGVMWEGVGILILFVKFGDQMMHRIMRKSVSYKESLNAIQNKEIRILKANKQMSVKTNAIQKGDIMIIRHGDLVALDGIAQSTGLFNYENITGESKLVTIPKNNYVLSGSYNSGDTIYIKATKSFKESYISKIISAIDRFSKVRPRAQLFADKILKYFVPTIFMIAIATFLTFFTIALTADWSLPWITNNDGKIDFDQALSSSIAVIAVACPCAIGMATPIIYSVTSIIASKNGIVINNPRAIEEIDDAQAIAFDKTGTITDEKMTIVKIKGAKKYVALAKALEKNINHPIAKAINNLPGNAIAEVKQIKLIANGVTGIYQKQVLAIKPITEDNDYTNLGLFVNNVLKLKMSLKSKVKANASSVINYFNKKHLQTLLVSGDNKNVCQDVANQINIQKTYYGKKAIEKTKIIGNLQSASKKVVFVGDGFNDSPAMKKANVSVAFASGSDITNSLSDISLINNDFKMVKKTFQLSKINNRRIKWSLFYAFLFNIIALPLAILGFLEPWIAAITMSLSNILVGLNGFFYLQTGNRHLKKM